ncbi:MAG: hypothetical protein O4965_27845 [Trichodesmium sp. St19_bin1]|nr:hypothetical protein [Trichodesmium sp. St7_bin2_1]MDE5123643.1 hypothetical protein [Trichodesmium sp. St19_bin1]
MTEIDEDRLPYDSEIYEKINRHIALSKDSYYGTMSVHSDYLQRVIWDDQLIQSNLDLECELIKVIEPIKLINLIDGNLRTNRLYIPYFECDRRNDEGKWEKVRREEQLHIMKTIGELSTKENIERLWKNKGKVVFIFSHKTCRKAHETRFFKWMKKNSPKHHYKLYGMTPSKVVDNPMSFIRY